ncbi:MAG TPA: low temperature requirement protein A [Solirubrobacterales bacterium]|nr:low temperature requirement protein A [Solirubrobacterales bacterium]
MEAARESARRLRFQAALREGERVSPLELFFDLVFVLAITQCTALMIHHPTWDGVAQGLLVLGVLWWTWVAYSWLTSVVDPEDDAVRMTIFVAMAAVLVLALCVPRAFGSLGLTFAIAYGIVRYAQIALFTLASRDDPGLRHSVNGLAIGTGIGVALLATASFFDGWTQGAIWALALTLDVGAPYFAIDAGGWKLAPRHFAERHGLILIVALGESIVAIGVAAELSLDAGIVAAAALGIGLVAALWWIYFDVVALVAEQRLSAAPVGRVRNEMARDSYSYLHFPMIAGIVLVALGLEQTLAHVGDPLHTVPAFALLGGVAAYLLGHVAFRYRHIHTVNRRRLGLAILLLALLPLAIEIPALATLAIVATLLWLLIAYETRVYGDARYQLRHPEVEPT